MGDVLLDKAKIWVRVDALAGPVVSTSRVHVGVEYVAMSVDAHRVRRRVDGKSTRQIRYPREFIEVQALIATVVSRNPAGQPVAEPV